MSLIANRVEPLLNRKITETEEQVPEKQTPEKRLLQEMRDTDRDMITEMFHQPLLDYSRLDHLKGLFRQYLTRIEERREEKVLGIVDRYLLYVSEKGINEHIEIFLARIRARTAEPRYGSTGYGVTYPGSSRGAHVSKYYADSVKPSFYEQVALAARGMTFTMTDTVHLYEPSQFR